nr:hypothetical protein [Tanacetum cinerariifolium]
MSKILKPICVRNLENSHLRMSQELKTVSYHKIYDILKQHQHEVNEIRTEKIARVANPLALVAQQQPAFHPQNHPTHYTQNSSTRSQQAATWNRGKPIVNSLQPLYDQEPSMVAEDDETSKDKEIDNSLRINRSVGYENQRNGNVAGARENVEVSPDAADSGPIFDDEPVQKWALLFVMKKWNHTHSLKDKGRDTFQTFRAGGTVALLGCAIQRRQKTKRRTVSDLAPFFLAPSLPVSAVDFDFLCVFPVCLCVCMFVFDEKVFVFFFSWLLVEEEEDDRERGKCGVNGCPSKCGAVQFLMSLSILLM